MNRRVGVWRSGWDADEEEEADDEIHAEVETGGVSDSESVDCILSPGFSESVSSGRCEGDEWFGRRATWWAEIIRVCASNVHVSCHASRRRRVRSCLTKPILRPKTRGNFSFKNKDQSSKTLTDQRRFTRTSNHFHKFEWRKECSVRMCVSDRLHNRDSCPLYHSKSMIRMFWMMRRRYIDHINRTYWIHDSPDIDNGLFRSSDHNHRSTKAEAINRTSLDQTATARSL